MPALFRTLAGVHRVTLTSTDLGGGKSFAPRTMKIMWTSPAVLLTKELRDRGDEGGRLLEFGVVPGAFDDVEPRAGNEAAIGGTYSGVTIRSLAPHSTDVGTAMR